MSNIHKNFNSRTRVGATSPMRAFGGTRMFQFTHPCGCDQALTLITKLIRVSIHAPVWVRRPCRPRPGAPGQVSIHAPVWVRPARKMDDVLFGLFQFTHPCGCDAGPPKAGDSIYRVSIHAPVWVRLCIYLSPLPASSFNSRTRVGATPSLPASKTSRGVSIHAPVWVRLYGTYSKQGANRFQFTHPCGCDLAAIKSNFEAMVSIHAPVWVRPVSWGMHMYSSKFQFTHPCGCDSALRSCPHYGTKFQFTHPCGCDRGGGRTGS